MFVIWRAKKPRCFKNVQSLPCRHRSQQISCMGGVLFEKLVREMDKKFVSEGKLISLAIGNCQPNLKLRIEGKLKI